MIGLDKDNIKAKLSQMHPNAKCELEYNRDYEFLISVMLSAQTTDKAVNLVTKVLFAKYNSLDLLNNIELDELEKILYSLGNYKKKSLYIKQIVSKLIVETEGKVINDKQYLLKLPGVGIKTVNVVLAQLYNVAAFAVDTHVYRVSYRLGISNIDDDVYDTEIKLMNFFDEDDYIDLHHKFIFHGRYICFKKKPNCSKCLFCDECIIKEK